MHAANKTRGLRLGLLGVVIFAMTTPMFRLAVGPTSDPQLSPQFVTAGRRDHFNCQRSFVKATVCEEDKKSWS